MPIDFSVIQLRNYKTESEPISDRDSQSTTDPVSQPLCQSTS